MKVKITKSKMQRYEDVRSSGITNMFAVNVVMDFADLTKEEVLDIMSHYTTYMKQFKIKRY